MNIFHAIVLAIIEGITEFLPISSTGHLILTSTLFHIADSEFVKSFEIFIQLGAILAVVVLYGKTIFLNKKILSRILAAFIPTAIIGFVLYKAIKDHLLGNPWIVVVSLIVGGIILILIELLYKNKKETAPYTLQNLPHKQAFFIGIAQSLSVIPGVSRAAATILGGQGIGLSRQHAVEFSFLLAIPTMIAATMLDLVKSNALTFTGSEIQLLSVGFIVAFITALCVIKFFLRFIQHHTFMIFGVYRILIACIYAIVVLQ
jgi:undecaprenyl-diphosphatase